MWIITAWQHISPKVSVKGFNVTDNDMLWNGSEEDGHAFG